MPHAATHEKKKVVILNQPISCFKKFILDSVNNKNIKCLTRNLRVSA